MPAPSTKTLPEPLPEAAVLICCIYDFVVVSFTDSPQAMQQQLREQVPASASEIKRENLAKPFKKNVGRVYWSPQLQQYWFILPSSPKDCFLLVASRMPAALKDKVPHLEPKKELYTDSSAGTEP